jgi:hypothetical protein
MTTHLCLVSAQVTPNLTPLLDPATRPEQVILVVSADMRQQADWLEQFIKPRGIKVSRWDVDNPYDVEAVRDQIFEQISEMADHEQLVLNTTGGTKPMSIAAYEVFRNLDLPIFYVHPEKDRLIWMHNPNKQGHQDLADRIKLDDFLGVHGAQVVGAVQRQRLNHRELSISQYLVEEIDRFSQPLGALNWLAGSTEGNLMSKPLSEVRNSIDDLKLLIDEFTAQGFLQLQDNRLLFSDEQDRLFVNGGWLELYTYDICAQLRSEYGLQDLGRNIHVQRTQRGKGIPNELDLALLLDNRLHIIECKTKKWEEHGPGANALYRLDTLKDLLGGLNARAMLISYRKLPKHDRQRAADLRIDVCAGRDLHHLKGKLRHWLGLGTD